MTEVHYPASIACSPLNSSSPSLALPYQFPILQPSSAESWRSISLTEDRFSGRTPLACFYALLHLHRPPLSDDRPHAKDGTAAFTLPHTLLFSQQSLPHVSPQPFLTLVDWFFSVPDPTSRPRVVRRTRQSVADTHARILDAFAPTGAASAASASPLPRALPYLPSPSFPSARPRTALRPSTAARPGTASAEWHSSYARPTTAFRAAEAIVAQLLSFTSTTSVSAQPTIRCLTASDLRCLLAASAPSPPATLLDPQESPSVDAQRQRLYTDLFHAHPHLTFSSSQPSPFSHSHPSPPVTSILQRFTYPDSPFPHAELLRVQWKCSGADAALCVIQRFTNTRSLFDFAWDAQERGRTWSYARAGDEAVDTGLVMRGKVVAHVAAACREVVEHISRVTAGQLRVAVMTLYVRREQRERVQLLWCDKLVFSHELDDSDEPTPSQPQQQTTSTGVPDPSNDSIHRPVTPSPLAAAAAEVADSASAAEEEKTQVTETAEATIPALAAGTSHAPFITAVNSTTALHDQYANQDARVDDLDGEDVSSSLPPLDVSIEHIGPPDGWADQVWQVIRRRREQERKDVREYERVVKEQAVERRKEAEAQQAAAVEVRRREELLRATMERKRPGRTAERRTSLPQVSAVSTAMLASQAMMASAWEDRGLLHHWKGRGTAKEAETARKAIWDGRMRGRATKDALQRERRQQQPLTRSPARKGKTDAGAAAKTEAEAVRANGVGQWRVQSALESAAFPRPLPLLLSARADVCIRCGLAIASDTTTLRLAALLTEDARLKRLLSSWLSREKERRAARREQRRAHREQLRLERVEDSPDNDADDSGGSSGDDCDAEAEEEALLGVTDALPQCVARLFPGMDAREWEWYRGRREFAGVEVEVCSECAEWCGGQSDGPLRGGAGEAEHGRPAGWGRAEKVREECKTQFVRGNEVGDDEDEDEDEEDAGRMERRAASLSALIETALSMSAQLVRAK